MNWIGDKIALLLVGTACAAGAWAILHYSGEWFFPAITLLTVVSMFFENRRLRALLRKHDIDPRSK
ncbi:hypothetical protein WKR88_12785 [Trinickia caryophylli]|uniref:Uncharacterized protein n=1 Tax=Trinickia caryophylli TaxID=28094 RepID=A0A1X7H3U5_TRICW|nr:hypothetical protein [Trinickia caryophylli]PMS08837.1 hypothetical protein C0Z17_28165 [Trinickia caryophylli]TRX17328.1 hypothetical protein FNF07_03155 [Trinickia caryophylli]WQE11932.1 hypothetical protein U0034_00410 [Trinickia caryophylli]SMF79304.1 hypothetical protein SAMN06295900_1218 [Trinickia caryophylli]GLU35678.1 hypothetical protein Busp01_55200 [Trinickia caryophylli]